MRRLIPIFAVVSTLTLPLSAQNWPGRAIRLVQGGAEVLDSAAAQPRRIYGDTNHRWVVDPSISPGGAFAALTHFERGPLDSAGRERPPIAFTVVVDASNGRPKLRVPGGLSYFWCGADCLAVLYGRYNEDSEGGPYGDSLDIFSPSDGRRVLAPRPTMTSLIAPHWFPHDSSIVTGGVVLDGSRYQAAPVARIDLRTGAIASTPLPLDYYSASGRFALHDEYGESNWVSASEDPATPIEPALEGTWQVEEWLGRTDKILLLFIPPRRPPPPGTPRGVRPIPPRDPNAPPSERTYRIWDLATGTVSDEWKAAETTWRGPAPNGCRLFLKAGRLTAAPGCR